MDVADVNGRIVLQRLIPDKHLSRAFGVLESLYMAGEGLGSFVASLLVVAIGTRATLVVAGLLLPIDRAARLVAPGRARRRRADPRGRDGAPARDADLRPRSPPPMLERVARNLVPVAATRGSP